MEKSICRLLQTDSLKIDEFDMAKIAFLRGYTGVYRDYESGKNDEKIATPGNWIIDSTVVSDFHSNSIGITMVDTENGDYFYLSEDAAKEYEKEIAAARNMTVDELLEDYRKKHDI